MGSDEKADGGKVARESDGVDDSVALVIYMPVIHRGYFNFLEKYREAKIYVLAGEVTEQFKPLRKDIRALGAEQVVEVLAAWKLGASRVVASSGELANLNTVDQRVVMPDEEPMREVAEQYFPIAQTEFEDVFLRWDKKKTLAKSSVNPDHQVSKAEFDQKMMAAATSQTEQAADWWRQVGGVVVQDGEVVLTARNHHLPDDRQPAFAGDPRGNFSKGQHIDLSTAQHAEASLVAQAAAAGVKLRGAEMYVTTFPCPVCAKLVAETGIKKLYYQAGYSMVDGERVMKAAGVELVRVEK
jgi:dCMP deaminase